MINSVDNNEYLVSDAEQSEDTVALKKLNEKLSKDSRVQTVIMNIGDGYTLVTKL